MNANKIFSSIRKAWKGPTKWVSEVTTLVKDAKTHSYYSTGERKSRATILRDLIVWAVKNKEVNRYYFVYGFDRKGSNRAKEVIPYKQFRYLRDTANTRAFGTKINYTCLVHDKFVFGQMLSSLRFPTPINIAFVEGNEITWLDNMQTVPIAEITGREKNIDGFCKQLTGMKGEGAFPLAIRDGKIYSGDNMLSADELQQKVSGRYLFQQRITQHPEMSRLHPTSVNTIRMITFNVDGKVEVLCAILRIGTKSRNVDNLASGGIVVGIDLETGKLSGEGLFKPGYGGRVTSHPDTGVHLDGYQLPFFKESLSLCTQLHKYMYGLHSIGWDIAMTPEGPIFIEGNEDWDGSIPMSIEKDFRKRFFKMFPRKFKLVKSD